MTRKHTEMFKKNQENQRPLGITDFVAHKKNINPVLVRSIDLAASITGLYMLTGVLSVTSAVKRHPYIMILFPTHYLLKHVYFFLSKIFSCCLLHLQ